jgi:hypothetical protein
VTSSSVGCKAIMNMLNRLTQPWEHVFDVIAAESRPCRRTLTGISTILNNKSQREATGLGNLYSQKTGKEFWWNRICWSQASDWVRYITLCVKTLTYISTWLKSGTRGSDKEEITYNSLGSFVLSSLWGLGKAFDTSRGCS